MPSAGEQLDVSVPAVARMYDYWLGGKDNYAADRQAADEVARTAPEAPAAAQANRRFLLAAVRYLAEQGIDQFIDIGAGIPTSPNVHEVARAVQPGARVVYVDNDPVVLAHTRALRAIPGEVACVAGDVRHPADILSAPVLRRTINLDRPVAVLLLAVLHFVPDEDDPASIAAVLHAGTCPGSALVVSHATASPREWARAQTAATVYTTRHAAAPMTVRTPDDVAALAADWKLGDLAPVTGWPHDAPWPPPAPVTGPTIVGGLAWHQ